MASAFEDVPVYKNQFLVRLKTNNYGSENSWKIENSQGEIVYSKDNFVSNTLNADTVILGNGCFKFTLEDTGGDGLDFWYWDALYNEGEIDQPDGSGFINFMYYDTISVFKTFHKDFGSRIVHSFRVENATPIDKHSMNSFEVYPTLTHDYVNVKSPASTYEKNIQLLDVKGRLLLEKKWLGETEEMKIDLTPFSDGIYFIKLKVADSLQTEKIIFNKY
jgi:predicted secreted protein